MQSDVSANASFFPFPDVEGGYEGTPLLIAGDIAGLVQEADAIRFDGSDAMPGAVGAGSFWTGMTGWVNGEIDLETALQNIEDSWPTETGDGSTEGG